MTSSKFCPVSMCITGNGTRRGDLTEDVDGLGLELVEVGQHVRRGHPAASAVK
jgi:hypothetical protein